MAMYQPPFSIIKLQKKINRKKENRINVECGSENFFEVTKERSP
jgi:hypothetical protein